jgi:hypothetical protein
MKIIILLILLTACAISLGALSLLAALFIGACSKKAAGKTGDARDAFMKTCLAADLAPSPQDKTKK